MRQKSYVWILFSVSTVLCAWSPWITQNTTSRLAEMQFNNAWKGIMDGCGIYGDDVGAQSFQKIPFGATVTVNYQCGLMVANEAPLQTTVYVSFFGSAFGYPKP